MPSSYPRNILDLFYPTACAGCDNTLMAGEAVICLSCQLDMPYAQMEDMVHNVMEMRLMGRFPFEAACSLLFFLKEGKVQRMMHELKYMGNTEVGEMLGAQLAKRLRASERYAGVDLVVPVPIHPRKRQKRGYNQAEIIARGMEEQGFVLRPHALKRLHNNASQTRKSMKERFDNVQQVFALDDTEGLAGQRILLLDDVLTTGATLEASAQQLLQLPGVSIYVATIACAEF